MIVLGPFPDFLGAPMVVAVLELNLFLFGYVWREISGSGRRSSQRNYLPHSYR
jgi:hypothetical protein